MLTGEQPPVWSWTMGSQVSAWLYIIVYKLYIVDWWNAHFGVDVYRSQYNSSSIVSSLSALLCIWCVYVVCVHVVCVYIACGLPCSHCTHALSCVHLHKNGSCVLLRCMIGVSQLGMYLKKLWGDMLDCGESFSLTCLCHIIGVCACYVHSSRYTVTHNARSMFSVWLDHWWLVTLYTYFDVSLNKQDGLGRQSRRVPFVPFELHWTIPAVRPATGTPVPPCGPTLDAVPCGMTLRSGCFSVTHWNRTLELDSTSSGTLGLLQPSTSRWRHCNLRYLYWLPKRCCIN